MTTIDDGADMPQFLRLAPPTSADVRDLANDIANGRAVERAIANDLTTATALCIRHLTLEEATKMAEQMGDVALRDKLNKWAIAYLDGGDLPLKTERRL